MTQQRTAPYIWVTWLSKLLVGDDSCVWSSWFRAHYQGFRRVDGSSTELVRWKMAHTRLLRGIVDELRSDNNYVTTEDQNSFRLTGSSGATLAGKPDAIAVTADGNVKVCDAKTGRQKASDVAQVMIYLYALARDPRYRGRPLEGQPVYGDGTQVVVQPDSLDGDFLEGLHDLLRRITDSEPAERVPSSRECAWCPQTTDDCRDRIETTPRRQRCPSTSKVVRTLTAHAQVNFDTRPGQYM